MKNILLRMFLMLLVIATVSVAFVGCDNSKDSGKNDDTTESTEETTDDGGDESESENTSEILEVPESVNFADGEKKAAVNVLSWDCFFTEFDVDSITGVEVDDAVFYRDENISERLGVVMEYTPQNGRHNTYSQYKAYVENSVNGGGDAYDLIACYVRSAAACASGGLLMELTTIEDSWLDTEKAWWNKNLIKQVSVQDSLFYVTGDASTSFVQMIYCIYFNQEMMVDRGLTSPYDLVANNEWTLANMMALSEFFYEDLNDNKKVDLGDMLPTAGQYFDWPAVLHGCGIGYVVKDADGNFVLNPELYGEKGRGIMDDLRDWVDLEGALSLPADQVPMINAFMEEQVMFLQTQSGCAARYFKDIEFEYACVPMPKYDSKQEEYISTVDQKMTMFCMPKNVPSDRIEMATATLECWGYEGYVTTTPIIFDVVMSYQKSTSQNMTDMLILIRDTAWFDLARIHAPEVGICDKPGQHLYANGDNWNTYLNNNVETLTAKVDKLNTDLMEAAGLN